MHSGARRLNRCRRWSNVPLASTAQPGPGLTVVQQNRPTRRRDHFYACSLTSATLELHGSLSPKYRQSRSSGLCICNSLSQLQGPAPRDVESGVPAGGLPSNLPGNPYWWEELQDDSGERLHSDEETFLTTDEVTDRVDEAAAIISLNDDMRPILENGYNSFAAVWMRLQRVPSKHRVSVLDELDAGAVRGLWRASLGRYLLPDALAQHLLRNFSVTQDFPTVPGQVFEYQGWVETWSIQESDVPFSVDFRLQSKYPREKPWLKPNPGNVKTNRKRLKMFFFVHPRSGTLCARVVCQLWGPVDNVWAPLYFRARPGLVLTPLQADAGADMMFEYGPVGMGRDATRAALARSETVLPAVDASIRKMTKSDKRSPPDFPLTTPSLPIHATSHDGTTTTPLESRVHPSATLRPGAANDRRVRDDDSANGNDTQGVETDVDPEVLLAEDLPDSSWPTPVVDLLAPPSPFSNTLLDYVRLAGPGVYVGCAYHRTAEQNADKNACDFFVIARKG